MLVIPKIMADAINQKLGFSLKMGQLATDVTNAVADITTSGNEINFPKYERVASVGAITKGTSLVPTEVSMSENVAKIQQTGGAIRVYDKDEKQIKGATLDNMAIQLVDAMVKDLDSSLSETMDAEAIKKSPQATATEITFNEILASISLFGDDVEIDSYAGLCINSRLLPSFYSMEQFVKIDYSFNQNNTNGIVKNGLVGKLLGIDVVVTNNGTFKDNETVSYLIKKGALGYVKQEEIGLEIEREGKLLANDIIVSSLYATKVMDKDGIVVIRKTIA